MSKTLLDMKERIAEQLKRADLLEEIGAAIMDAIEEYQKERFRFSEPSLLTMPPFNTVPGQTTYTVADNANIPTLLQIDYITYVQNGGVTFELDRWTPEEINLANQGAGTMVGEPEAFCYAGNAITIYPEPNAVFPMSIGGYFVYPAPASDTEANNPWMNAAERLIRSRAKYELALHVLTGKDAVDLAVKMSPEPGSGGACDRYFNALKIEVNRVRASSRIRPMRF